MSDSLRSTVDGAGASSVDGAVTIAASHGRGGGGSKGPHATTTRLALVQLRPQKARVEANLRSVGSIISEELAGSFDIALFPETVLSGYFLEGGVERVALSVDELVQRMEPPPPEAPDVVVGFFERFEHRVHNSAAYLQPAGASWSAVHVHRKVFLPTYGLFDEGRFVEAGRSVEAFDTRFGRMGILICEDMWHSLPAGILAVGGARAILVPSASPVRGLGAESNGRPANLRHWDELGRAAAREHGVYVAVGQLTGSEGGKLFAGGSTAFGPDGSPTSSAPLWEDGVTPALLDWETLDRARAESPLLGDLVQALPYLGRSLVRAAGREVRSGSGARLSAGTTDLLAPETSGEIEPSLLPPDVSDEIEPSPLPPGVSREVEPSLLPPGVSGEIEPGRFPPSASGKIEPSRSPSRRISRPQPPQTRDALKRDLRLDLPLVERTLVEFLRDEMRRRRGFDKAVVGVSGGVDSAVTLYLAVRALGAENVHALRLPYRTSSPESLAHARLVTEACGASERTIDISGAVDDYAQNHEREISPLRLGNVMARFRAVVIFDQSAKLDALPLGTGNKSERLLGYFTWHADDSPPLNPLGDLYKTQVWDLARHLGVPEAVVDKPASADLIVGVDDEDELGVSYHEADPILHGLISGWREGDLVDAGFPAAAVGIAAERLRTSHYKRSLPAVAVVSSTAIGESYLRPVDY